MDFRQRSGDGIRAKIRWSWEQFVGPEATKVDTALTVGLAVLGGVLAPIVLRRQRSPNVTEVVLTSGLALDLWGGAWANNTRACARWYERSGQTNTAHYLFALPHVHPFAVAWLDRDLKRQFPGWAWAGAHYTYLLGATFAARRFPEQRRVLGLTLTLGGLLLDHCLGTSRSVPWFAATYYPKLLMGHATASLWTDRELALSLGEST